MIEEAELLGCLKSGERVTRRPRRRSTTEPLDRELVSRALAQVKAGNRIEIKQRVNFPDVVGLSRCVQVKDGRVIYAREGSDDQLTKFVIGVEPQPHRSVVVILRRSKDGDGYYEIVSYVGDPGEPQPWDPRIGRSGKPTRALELSLKFWETRALVLIRPILCHVCGMTAEPPTPQFQGVICTSCQSAIQAKYGNEPPCVELNYPGWGTLQMPVL